MLDQIVLAAALSAIPTIESDLAVEASRRITETNYRVGVALGALERSSKESRDRLTKVAIEAKTDAYNANLRLMSYLRHKNKTSVYVISPQLREIIKFCDDADGKIRKINWQLPWPTRH